MIHIFMGLYRLKIDWKIGNRTKIVGQRKRLLTQTYRVPVIWPVLHDRNKCTGKVHSSEFLSKSHQFSTSSCQTAVSWINVPWVLCPASEQRVPLASLLGTSNLIFQMLSNSFLVQANKIYIWTWIFHPINCKNLWYLQVGSSNVKTKRSRCLVSRFTGTLWWLSLCGRCWVAHHRSCNFNLISQPLWHSSHMLLPTCCITLLMEKQHDLEHPMAECARQKALLKLIGGLQAI